MIRFYIKTNSRLLIYTEKQRFGPVLSRSVLSRKVKEALFKEFFFFVFVFKFIVHVLTYIMTSVILLPINSGKVYKL